MAERRLLSIWFPRMGVEQALRRRPVALPEPFAVVADRNGAQVLHSLNPEAEAAGLSQGQSLRDARAICPALVTVAADERAEAMFLTALRRWAGKFSPWIAEEPPAGLALDVTGCAHLFGGEEGLVAQVEADCEAMGLTVRAGLADTVGAAWALARYAGRVAGPVRNGDAIAQEAHATRSKAAKRRGWERGGAAPAPDGDEAPRGVIAPKGKMRQALAGLPLAALRLDAAAVEGLARLGLRRVEDIAVLPRAALARRFGAGVLRRLDQALGLEAEPVTPSASPLHFAVRLNFPDPIGLLADVEAGVDRLLPALCVKLTARSRGARRVRLQAFRTDGEVRAVEVGLARASDRVESIRPLLALKLDQIEAGFGIDMLRLEAVLTEPLSATQYRARMGEDAAPVPQDTGMDALVGKLGARLGAEAVTRLHPAESHAPERGYLVMAAAWSRAYGAAWPERGVPRPLVLLGPEPIGAPDDPAPPLRFRWRRRDLAVRVAVGPERIAPEWWLDRPEWRSGPRDYWRVETEEGQRLWLFYAHGGEVSGGWFCHGLFP
ncbi:DNA polymerase Y family protein [Paragemmobacter straminiformis]|uniref:DNA polymerase Y family protein n=1 Tax=Paragemmobacter straminiformis TaxID=2045119 RepID=A0A842IA99_9RHOB|nr:DNA polymerase Y family protein [Gemmobacter straminiformis]MBC2836277.1 DNA polymerase Y family protein [Gemmobacter straminiformis]